MLALYYVLLSRNEKNLYLYTPIRKFDDMYSFFQETRIFISFS